VAALGAGEARADGSDAPAPAAIAQATSPDAPPAAPASPKRTLAFAGGHAAYAIGAAVGNGAGFRQGLDLGVMAGLKSYDGGSSSGLPSERRGLVFGASSLIGFGKYPSYVAGEIGGGADNAFTGWFCVFGPAVRVDPTAGAGLGLRLGGDVVLIQAALHLLVIVAPDPEITFALTVGFGRD
jgi:hypothetical protein